VYAVVFAGDLLLVIGLIMLALQQVLAEQRMLANLDKGAAQRPGLLNPALRPEGPNLSGSAALPD
jgi:hypothetical protein